MHKDYPHREWLIDRVKSLVDHPRGQQILNIYRAEKIGISSVDTLEPFEQLYQQYLSMKTLTLQIPHHE
jgi:hypothetical protein